MQSVRVLGNSISFLQKQLLSCSACPPSFGNLPIVRAMSTGSESLAMLKFVGYLDNLKNYEQVGVPRNAGTDSADGFDLGRMRRLMARLGNPQLKYKVVHIAGTKGKGSTAAYLSNILRAEGYSVGCYTSPHVQTIRERMTLGNQGHPVSEDQLLSLFHTIRKFLDQAVEFECGRLSHFEVLTAIAFALFAQEKIDIAVVEAGLGGARDATNIIDSSILASSVITTIGEEHMAALGGSLESIAVAKSGIIKYGCPLVLGGPFLPHIEQIIRDYASSMSSPVISAINSRNRIVRRGLKHIGGKPVQICDIVIQSEEISSSVELLGVNLSMLGGHQLQNAATATCAALCLRNQGWRISDGSFLRGLADTKLLGRSQFLTAEEAEALGLSGSMILLDGAHTRDSAKALRETIHMVVSEAKIVLVVAMASDKDHAAFARELLSGLHLEAVLLTEVDVAGNKSRTTSALSLRDTWIKASNEQGIHINPLELVEDQKNLPFSFVMNESGTIVAAESSLTVALRFANQILRMRARDQVGSIVATGSLHIVSSVLASANS